MKNWSLCLTFLLCTSQALSFTFSSHEVHQFEKFEREFGKKYVNKLSRSHRMKIFVENLREIESHNANPRRTYNKGINKFSDLTEKEFIDGYLGYKKTTGFTQNNAARINLLYKVPKELPENVNWAEKGAIGIVREQGHCGSCWAFASTENIESYVFLETGVLPTLSPQQITSCSVNPYSCGGTGGCHGAISQIGYMYTQLYGLSLEEDYPYISGRTNKTEECKFEAKSGRPLARIRGYETLPSNDMHAVLSHLAQVGPLAVNVDASAFRQYANGIIDGCDFDKNININHVVQLIGYGTDDKLGPYWLVKNSWGSDWGDKGILKLKRYPETRCGLDATPLNGTGCVDDGNNVQKVCGNCGIIFDTSYPIGATLS